MGGKVKGNLSNGAQMAKIKLKVFITLPFTIQKGKKGVAFSSTLNTPHLHYVINYWHVTNWQQKCYILSWGLSCQLMNGSALPLWTHRTTLCSNKRRDFLYPHISFFVLDTGTVLLLLKRMSGDRILKIPTSPAWFSLSRWKAPWWRWILCCRSALVPRQMYAALMVVCGEHWHGFPSSSSPLLAGCWRGSVSGIDGFPDLFLALTCSKIAEAT